MVVIPTLEEMLKKGVHFGHQASRWNPKMKPFIFTTRNGIHILNLELTRQKLQEAIAFAQEIVKGGGVILFVGTRRQAKKPIKEGALACGMPYITTRWLGGILTNFETIKKVINKLATLERRKVSEIWKRYTKKERMIMENEIAKLKELIGGIKDLKKLPDAIFVVDVRFHSIAIREAKKKGVPIIGVVDTNSDTAGITKVIPANDDATKAVQLYTSLMSQAILEAKGAGKALAAPKTLSQIKEPAKT